MGSSNARRMRYAEPSIRWLLPLPGKRAELLGVLALAAGCAGARAQPPDSASTPVPPASGGAASAKATPPQPSPAASSASAPNAAPTSAIRDALRGGELFMSSVPVQASDAALAEARAALGAAGSPREKALGFSLSVTLEEGESFELLAGRVPGAKVRGSQVRLPFRPPALAWRSTPAARLIQPSFVVDFDSPRFQPFATSFDEHLGATHDAHAIESFVSGYITHKSYARGFDIASDVASSKTGDCTEHAVLLAAALRRRGIASRVVFGLLFVFGERLDAFGHAWVEADWGRGPERLDAAVFGITEKYPVLVHYWPIAALVDEGPGFSRAMIQQHGVINVTQVTLTLASERPPDSAASARRPRGDSGD